MSLLSLSGLKHICDKTCSLLSISDPSLYLHFLMCSSFHYAADSHTPRPPSSGTGTDMTPNYVDNSFSNWTISPWCTCEGSGNQEEGCYNFLRFFTDNTCLSEPPSCIWIFFCFIACLSVCLTVVCSLCKGRKKNMNSGTPQHIFLDDVRVLRDEYIMRSF